MFRINITLYCQVDASLGRMFEKKKCKFIFAKKLPERNEERNHYGIKAEEHRFLVVVVCF